MYRSVFRSVFGLFFLFLSQIGSAADFFPSDQSLFWGQTRLQWITAQLKQLRYGPTAVSRLRELLREEMSAEVLDANLWAFRGFHEGPPHRHYQMRQWVPANPNLIQRDQIQGMSPELYATIVRVAVEIEDPIMDYSLQSGPGFRKLHPNLGRFMGRDRHSLAYAQERGLKWCDSAWCREEDRHADALAVIFRQIVGRPPARDNPAPPEEPIETIAYAIKHLDSRGAAEWAASSTYAGLLIHSRGDLYRHVLNLYRDEIKHFAIMCAFDRYLHGPNHWRRLNANLRMMMTRAKAHLGSGGRSGAGNPLAEPLFLLETLLVYALEEQAIRQWLDTLPYSTLREVFETRSNLPPYLADSPDPKLLAQWNLDVADSEKFRLSLELWKSTEANQAKAEWAFLQAHRESLRAYVDQRWNGFRGAEDYNSEVAERVRREIRALKPLENSVAFPGLSRDDVRAALQTMLRNFQLANNYEMRVFRGEMDPDPDRFNTKKLSNLLFEACGGTPP